MGFVHSFERVFLVGALEVMVAIILELVAMSKVTSDLSTSKLWSNCLFLANNFLRSR